MKKQLEEHQRSEESSDTGKRTREAVEGGVSERRARVSEVLEAEPTEEEQGFLESLGLESIEALVRDEDAAMTALSLCGTSEGLQEVSPALFGRLLCALATMPEYARMIVESEEDNSFRDAIQETPKAKRPLYLAQLQRAVKMARATLEEQKAKRKKKA